VRFGKTAANSGGGCAFCIGTNKGVTLMKLKDATSGFGSVGFLLSILLTFLVYADAAYACPGHESRVVYRTVTNRNIPTMRTTVISYGGPANYAPCDNSYNTRRVKYVAAPARSYYGVAPGYVAVQNVNGYYPVNRTRYVAVRNVEMMDAPRYVAVRRQPAYVNSGAGYVVISNNVPNTRYVAVRDMDMDDLYYDHSPRHRVVSNYPVYDTGTRYVAVRNSDYDMGGRYAAVRDYDNLAARYVTVRNSNAGCTCAAAGEDELGTLSRHVVLRTDDLAGTQEVVYPDQDQNYDDTAYVVQPSSRFVAYENAGFAEHRGLTLVPDDYAGTASDVYIRMKDDSENYDQAIPDTRDVTYVASNGVADACLSPVAHRASPVILSRTAVSYAPVEEVDYDNALRGSPTIYVVADNSASETNYVPVGDADTGYSLASDVNNSCSCPVVSDTFDSDADSQNISYYPVSRERGVNVGTVSYEPLRRVSYVPVDNNVDYEPVADTSACECPVSENIVTAPDGVTTDYAGMVDNTESAVATDVNNTEDMAASNGYRDGFEDGKNAAVNGNDYRPEDSAALRSSNGYDEKYGHETVYADAYRDKYLEGYRAGFSSITDNR
jgi:hypothetical protein